MSQLRLVILDNTKDQLNNADAQKVLSDMIFVKQRNFLRTDPNYVVMDKHDMIGTHYLIYDTTDLLHPRLVFAIRTTFQDRAEQNRVETPLMSLVPKMEPKLQQAFKDFNARHPRIVDCNAWFVDPAFSKKNSGLRLSDIGYFMVCLNILRFGYDHFVGCTNETYNASRWLEKVGSMPQGLLFEHPAVKASHKLILMENFNMAHFQGVYDQYGELIQETYEVLPENSSVQKLGEFAAEKFKQNTKARLQVAA